MESDRSYLRSFPNITSRQFISRLVGLVIICLGLISISVATGSSSWVVVRYEVSDLDAAVTSGLWSVCMQIEDTKLPCTNYDLVEGWLSACRALMILACIACLFSVLSAVVGLVKDEALLRLAGSFIILTGIMTMAASILFLVKTADNMKDIDNFELSGSCGLFLAIFGCAMCCIAAILMFIPCRHGTGMKAGRMWTKSDNLPEEAQTLLVPGN